MAMAVIIIAVTAGIMSTRSRETVPRVFAASAALFIGLVLLGVSGQRCLAYFHLARVPSEIDDGLKSGRALSPETLAQAREAYLRAARILPGASEVQQNLGRIELRLADAAALAPAARMETLASASGHFAQAIAAAPARAFPWSLAALAHSELAAPPERIASSLRYSYFLGPHEASSLLLRATVALAHWDGLPEDVRRNTGRDLERIWRLPPLRTRLISLYLAASFPLRIEIRRTVVTTEEDRRIFDYMVREAAGLLKRR